MSLYSYFRVLHNFKLHVHACIQCSHLWEICLLFFDVHVIIYVSTSPGFSSLSCCIVQFASDSCQPLHVTQKEGRLHRALHTMNVQGVALECLHFVVKTLCVRHHGRMALWAVSNIQQVVTLDTCNSTPFIDQAHTEGSRFLGLCEGSPIATNGVAEFSLCFSKP